MCDVMPASQMYLYVGKWKFKVMERKEVERQAVALRMTALDGHKHGQQHQHPQRPQNGASHDDASTLHDLENGMQPLLLPQGCCYVVELLPEGLMRQRHCSMGALFMPCPGLLVQGILRAYMLFASNGQL